MKKCIVTLVLFFVISIILFIGCNHETPNKINEEKEYFEDNKPSIILMVNDSLSNQADSLFYYLQKSLRKIEIDSQSFYVVEGDLLMDEDELYYYCQNRITSLFSDSILHTKKREEKAFTISTINGFAEIWPKDFVIKYSVLRNSFNLQKDYDSVVQYMKSATTDWMSSCGIRFEHIQAFDQVTITRAPPEPLTFVVRQLNTNGAFIAQAFFPGDPPHKRRIYIDPIFFRDTGFSKTGILRHELGHVIGARHEHIWSKEYECQGENIVEGRRGARQLTDYDPYSVMHYLCGYSGTRNLILTAFDIEGAQKIYGLPRN